MMWLALWLALIAGFGLLILCCILIVAAPETQSKIIALIALICTVAVISILLRIIDRRCPSCHRLLTLSRRSIILIEATPKSKGKQQTIRHCSRCRYHREYEEDIPIDDDDDL